MDADVDADVDDAQLWSPAAREGYAQAVERVHRALDRHNVAIAGSTDTTGLAASAAELEAALASLSDAEHALTGAAAFWLDLDDPADDATDEPSHGDDQGDESIPVVAQLQLTMDVTDTDRLLALARQLDPAAPVSSMEDAVFVVTGRLGWDQLLADQIDGVTMQGATARLDTP